jgi:hypothetical protein
MDPLPDGFFNLCQKTGYLKTSIKLGGGTGTIDLKNIINGHLIHI